ncbi:MAG: lamin tail domain-containing protein, partial [Deltaproteobacteria bacterium]|nr:lamin tail domain-containing protein [Deltaproteobacteria bacterium]
MLHRFVVRGRSALLCITVAGLAAACDSSPEQVVVADAGVAIPDGGLALPDGGLSAAGAGVAGAISSEGQLTLAEFRGVVDVAAGSMTFEMLEGDEVTSPALRRLQKGLCALSIVQDGTPGSGPADSLELVTDATGLDAACTGYAASPLFCGDVTIRSFYTTAKNNAYAQITALVPSTGYAVQNGDSISGASSGLGSFSYGNLAAAPGPGNSASRPWVFARAGGNFTFQGRVVIDITELCNGTDEDCDGLVDENAGCFAAGTACTATADCAAGLDCNSGLCGAPGAAGSACVTTAACNAGLTCLSSVCTSVTTPAAAGDLLVTEVMPRSISGTGDLGEWFEIHNPTTSYWDISTCAWDDNNSTNLISSLTRPSTGANSMIVAPGAYLVFAQSAVAAENHDLDPDFIYDPLIALSNTADLVRIKCGTTVIDEVAWTASSTGFVALSKSAQLDRTILSSTANDDYTNWCTPSTPTYSTGYSGTPGAQNASCFVNQTIDRCRLDTPATISQITSTTANVYGRVRILGLSDLTNFVDLNGLVKMQAGYGTTGSDASTWTNWSPSGVASIGYGSTITTEAGFDEYRAQLTVPSTVGNYDFAVRFSGDGGTTWTYCDKNAGAGADGSENGYQAANAGALTARTPPNNPGVGGLVISELMVASQAGSPDDGEWIEVYNPSTTETYDLDGCSIGDGTNSVGITTTTTVAPGAYFLFGRSTDSAANFGAPVDFAWGINFQLNNSGENPTLNCGTTVVDTVVYPQLFEREQGASFQLHPGTLDAVTNDAATTAWCNSRTTFGAFGKKGTPKAANPSCNVTIDSCQLVSPTTAQTGYAGATATIAATYSVAGLTNTTTGFDYASRIVGEAAFGPDGADPTASTSNWAFTTGSSDAAFSDAANDRSVTTATFPALGSYDIAYRMSGDGGATWTYCDTTLNLTNADYAAADSVALTTTTPPGPPTAAGDIIFSEIMASSGLGSTGSPSTDRGEWVEVRNTTANDLNLAGCSFTDGEATTTIPGALVIVAGGYAIFGQDDSIAANGGLTGVALNYADGIALSNSGDNLTLSCDTLVLDTFTYPSSFGSIAGRSRQLAPDRTSSALNDNSGNWCATTGAIFAGTRTGTPGAANTPCFVCRAEAPATVTGVPGSVQSLTARIKIPGLTDGANVQSGPQVQFGIGPDGSNPSTTDLALWNFAAGAGTVGWDGSAESLYDEYTDSYTMTTQGYDWAARLSGDGGVSWTYCDRNVGAGADGSENGYQPANAGTVAPTATYTVGGCLVTEPTSVSAAGGTAAAVRGQIIVAGVTDATNGLDTNSSVVVQAAYGADGTLPATWSGWTTATGDPAYSASFADAYDASLTVGLTTGGYDFAFRVSGDAGTSWTYCDTTGGTYAAADAGTLTVTPGTSQSYTITDCSIVAPTSITGTVSTTSPVAALVQIAGLTDYSSGLNLASTVQVELGQGADGTDPSTWTGWAAATGDGSFSNATSDKYGATLTLPSSAGNSDFAFRVTGDSGATWTYCDSTGGSYLAADAGSVTANPNAFLAGNFLVQVMGDGSTLLSSAAAAISIREYGTTGSLITTVSSAFTSTNLLTDSGSATSNGYLGVWDGLVAVSGSNSALATASVAGLNTKAVNLLGADRSLATRVTFPTGGPTATPPSPYSGNNFRSVVPT